MEGFVDIEYGLNVVVAGWNRFETDQRITESRGIDDCAIRGSERIHIESEKLRTFRLLLPQLEARFRLLVLRNAEQDVTIQRLAA